MNRDQAAAGALASWTAAVLCRFWALAPGSKAPEDWRTPKPGGAAFGSWRGARSSPVGHWGDGTLNFPIKAQDSGRRGKTVARWRHMAPNSAPSPEGEGCGEGGRLGSLRFLEQVHPARGVRRPDAADRPHQTRQQCQQGQHRSGVENWIPVDEFDVVQARLHRKCLKCVIGSPNPGGSAVNRG